MGFFDFLFGKPLKIDNEFFGTMLFCEYKREPLKGYFECSRHFKPSGKIIEIGIDGDATGPTQLEVNFF